MAFHFRDDTSGSAARTILARSGADRAPGTEVHEAWEALEGEIDAPVFLTCEHASQRLPAGWSWPERDRRLVGTHWAYDLGAAEIARELAAALRAPAVLSRFTRLLADPNRAEEDDSLFRTRADGEPVELNLRIDDDDRRRRLEGYHRPYHRAIDERLGAHRAEILFSIHTFTPVYEGQVRRVEVGVLFDTQERLACDLARAIADAGFVTALNEPWSGREGLIYAAERHAGAHGRRALELEVRQDLAVSAEVRSRLVPVLARFFSR